MATAIAAIICEASPSPYYGGYIRQIGYHGKRSAEAEAQGYYYQPSGDFNYDAIMICVYTGLDCDKTGLWSENTNLATIIGKKAIKEVLNCKFDLELTLSSKKLANTNNIPDRLSEVPKGASILQTLPKILTPGKES